jgi:hypothetical protein
VQSARVRGTASAPARRGLPSDGAPTGHNAGMNFFYGFMVFLMAATLLPSILFLVLYFITGEEVALQRAAKMWNYLRAFTLLGFNITVWGNVLVGLWQLMH